MFESCISATATEKLPGWENTPKLLRGPTRDAQKCIERFCELANKKVEHLHKVSCVCLDDHQIKKEELESIGNLSKVCSKNVLKCLYLARIGGPDILWSVNKLERSARNRHMSATDDWPD